MKFDKKEMTEKEESITSEDIPNFRRTPRIEKLEELVGSLMEEIILLKGRADYREGVTDALRTRIERLELERDVD